MSRFRQRLSELEEERRKEHAAGNYDARSPGKQFRNELITALQLIVGMEARQTPLDEIGMSTRTAHALKSEGFSTVEQVIASSDAALLRMPNFGRKSLNEVRELFGHKAKSASVEERLTALEQMVWPLGR